MAYIYILLKIYLNKASGPVGRTESATIEVYSECKGDASLEGII